MDIACPTCAATYEIDDASVAETGRKVRCAECTTIWRVYRGGRAELISAPAPPPTPVSPPVPITPPALVAPPLAPTEQDIAATAELPADAGTMLSEVVAAPAVQQEPEPQPRGKAKITAGPRKSRAAKPGGGLRKLFSPPVLATAVATGLLVASFVMRERVVRLLPQTAVVFAALGAPVNLRGIDIRDVKSRLVDDNGVNVLVIDGNLVNTREAQAHVPRLRFAVLGDRGQELYVWSAQADRSNLKPGETLNFRRRLAAPPADGRDVSVRFLSASDITAGLK
jgi:predicted Zn finger-like uncharacterized protein